MNLKEFYQKKVRIKYTEEKIFTGFVEDYVFPEDNESENESIIIRTQEGELVEFEESDIQEIKVI